MNAIPLSPVDYVFTGKGSQPITFAFSYQTVIDPELLQKSLKTTLEYFPLLSSQLNRISDSDYEYRMTPDGLIFKVNESDKSFHESDRIEHYVTPVNSIPGDPLTRITMTRTPAGSVLAVSVSHALVDGFSYFHFLSSWARICRGDQIFPPQLDRSFLKTWEEKNVKQLTPVDFSTTCGLYYSEEGRTADSETFRYEHDLISEATIRSHIEDVKRLHGISCTENDVITALLWKKYLTLWNQESDRFQASVTCPFDFRRALPDFPKIYFGCAIVFATAMIEFQDLLKASVPDLALLIRNAISRMKTEYILDSMTALSNLRRQNGISAMEHIHLRHPHHGMIVTNLTRMPIQDLDFGFGPPKKFITYAEINRSAAILPAEQGVKIFAVT